MAAFNRRVFSFAVSSLLAVGIAACGSPEPEQRKSFIAFLKTMIDRPGVHVMNLKPDDEKTFGEYTKHYAVILNFNTGMRTVMEEFAGRLKQLGLDQSTPRTIEQMVAHRADISVVSEGLQKSNAGMETQLATAKAERAALKQPEEVRQVYDLAFDKLIAGPVRGVEDTYAGLSGAVTASLQLVDYIIAHPAKLTVSGSQVRASDAKTLDELNVLLKAHNAAGVKFNEARMNLRKIMEGG